MGQIGHPRNSTTGHDHCSPCSAESDTSTCSIDRSSGSVKYWLTGCSVGNYWLFKDGRRRSWMEKYSLDVVLQRSQASKTIPIRDWLSMVLRIVREYVFYVFFFKIQKTRLFTFFWSVISKKRRKRYPSFHSSPLYKLLSDAFSVKHYTHVMLCMQHYIGIVHFLIKIYWLWYCVKDN